MVYSILISWLFARQRERDYKTKWKLWCNATMGKDMVTTQNKNSDITERIENSHPWTPKRPLQDLWNFEWNVNAD